MFYLIGIGLKPQHLTLEAVDALKQCAAVYCDAYTSRYAEGTLQDLEVLIEKKVKPLARPQIENEMESLLAHGKSNDVALLVFGNPFFATTHIQLLIEAKKLGVKLQVIAGISMQDFLGATGLSSYKFGQITSIPFPQENYKPESFYDVIKNNKECGQHTLCLLDLVPEQNKFMSTQQAMQILEGIALQRNESWLQEQTVILMAGLGSKNQEILQGNFENMKNKTLNGIPQALIIAEKLSENELKGLSLI